MIVEGLVDFALMLVEGLFSGFQLVSLPIDMMTSLLNFFCYGTWVVGVDLMAIIITTIVTWFTIKFGIGLVLFIWRLLPLT